jgi:hypothetical protein
MRKPFYGNMLNWFSELLPYWKTIVLEFNVPIAKFTRIWSGNNLLLRFLLIGVVKGGVQFVRHCSHQWPIVPARMILLMDKLVEWLAGETEVLGENLPQCRFVYNKPHILPGRELGPPLWKASD